MENGKIQAKNTNKKKKKTTGITSVKKPVLKIEKKRNVAVCFVDHKGDEYLRLTYGRGRKVVREDNKRLGITSFFTYNRIGLLVKIEETDYTLESYDQIPWIDTHTLFYDEKMDNRLRCYNDLPVIYINDKMIEFNGKRFRYDNFNNVVSISKTRNPDNLAEYGYNENHELISKITCGHTFSFEENCNHMIVKMIYDNYLTFIFSTKRREVFGFRLQERSGEWKKYKYEIDELRNVTGILDENGKKIVSYVYDQLGNCEMFITFGNHFLDPDSEVIKNSEELSFHRLIGELNPYRYKMRFCHTEANLFYHFGKFYSPEVGQNIVNIQY